MQAILWPTGQRVELLTKGMTTRRGHWHRYGSQLKWVQTHPLSYHEGTGGHQLGLFKQKDKENEQQGSLFDLAHEFAKKPIHKTVRLVVPAKRVANSQQMSLFGQRPQIEPVHHVAAEEKQEEKPTQEQAEAKYGGQERTRTTEGKVATKPEGKEKREGTRPSAQEKHTQAKELTAFLPEQNKANGQIVEFINGKFRWKVNAYKEIDLGYAPEIAKQTIESSAWLYEKEKYEKTITKPKATMSKGVYSVPLSRFYRKAA